jgi:hypothetical protein
MLSATGLTNQHGNNDLLLSPSLLLSLENDRTFYVDVKRSLLKTRSHVSRGVGLKLVANNDIITWKIPYTPLVSFHV